MDRFTLRGRLVLKEDFNEGYMAVAEFYKAGLSDCDDLLDILRAHLGPVVFDDEVEITVRVLESES